ncbi:MAG: syringopeptin synthetase C [Benniella sp.]|nr:MAG: syringopeptin synthetase C [Benniella sp.]
MAEPQLTGTAPMDERSRLECGSSLDAKSHAIAHTLKESNTVILSAASDEKERLLVSNGSIASPSNVPEQESLPLSQIQYRFWKKTLADAPAMLDLPTDRPRPSHRPAGESRIPILFDTSLTQSLRKLALEHDMDFSMVVMAGWGAVLGRLSNQDDIIIGYHSSGPAGPGSSQQTDSSSILPLRLDLFGETNTFQLLERVRNVTSASMDLQGIPLDSISDIAGPPLFQVALRWIQAPSYLTVPIHVDLELQLQELENEVVGDILFSSELFSTDTIKRHVGYLIAILRNMIKDPTRPVGAIDILSAEEKRLVLETWNETSEAYPDHLCIHQLFENQVEKSPDATAIVSEDQSQSYSELNSRANRLAHHLIGLGVRPDTRVAICVERSPAMVVGILAIMKAGGAYVPLDPSYASGRIKDILQDASPTIAVADQIGRAVLEDSALVIVDPDMLLDYPTSNCSIPGLTSRHLAYLIYTSGSTGKPKGVMIEHRGVVNLTQAHMKLCGFHPTARVLQFASCGFDTSVWEILLTLTSGASLYIPPAIVRQDRDEFWNYMAKHLITVAAPAPALLQDGKDLPEQIMSTTLALGGEALSRALLQNLISLGCKVINDYGPTETTVSAISWCCPPSYEDDIVPIGRPLCNTRVYILDSFQQPVPVGVAGELYIGGAGVARGYLNRPDLTAERFLLDPFVDAMEARMYRTGDLVRYLPDGNIVFLGRNDDQVKIRGFRIELGEIEARLSDHPLVQKAAVLTLGEGAAKRLVAYVIAKPENQLVNTLRSHLASCLPNYMIPAAIVRLDAFPLTTSGKIDRNALPEPDSSAFAREAYEKPQGEVETCLAQLWAELLSLDHVSRNDNFFALGGHSLMVARMLNRLRQLDFTIPVSAVYQYPVLNVLAQALERHRPESIPQNVITPQTIQLTPAMLPLISLSQVEIDYIVDQTPGGVANIQDIYSLSSLQDGILFHHLLATEGDPYLISTQMAFETRDLLDRYIQAFQQVVNRHDILRTAYVWKDISTPAQVVWRQASLPVQEFTLDPTDGPIAKQLDKRFHPKHFLIDLTQAPLVRLMIAQDTDGRWILFQLMHHIIGDQSAGEMLYHEIEQILHGQGQNLPTPQSFRNAIAQARSSSHHDIHKRFFEDMLGDIEEPTFPYGMAEVNHNGAQVTESYSIFPQDLNDRLRFQAKQMGVSLASLCHVAWSLVLARTTGQERIVFGTVLFGGAQNAQESDPTMGLFINTLPFRCDINSQGVRDCVRQIHTRLAALLEHEHASLALAQKCSGVPAGTPLFSALLNYLHTSLPSGGSQGFDLEFINSQEEQVHYPGVEFLGGWKRTNYPFMVNVLDFDTALGLTVQTQQPIDPNRVGSYMEQAIESLVIALESNPDVAVSTLQVLPLEERNLLLQELSTLTMEFPQHQLIHGLFEKQVESAPEATALVFSDQSITYLELNKRANRLAHHLIGLGVKPDSLVAICVGRSFAMIVGVLAVLKAGGAYVPLDPSYPKDRLAYILDDAAPTIALVDTVGHTALIEASQYQNQQKDTTSMIMIDPNDQLSSSHLNPEVLGLTSRCLAYIVYTSGSTGRPKGVMIEHQGVVNFALSRISDYGLDASSRMLQFSSLNFDLSVMETFTAFYSGASLHLLEDRTRLDRHELWGYIERHAITQAILPPAILQECKNCPPSSTRLTLISCGEELPVTLLRVLQQLIPNGSIINEYGPSETAIGDVAWRCPKKRFDGDVVPIGRPIGNKKVYLLDKDRQPVPMGAIGELYIGGVGVARGYLNRPELTVKAFLADPFAVGKDARMYKTGDLARYLPDGNIVFLGRNDHQVKIRGFRIELGEIETRLCEHPLVDKAAVITDGEGSHKRLVGYVVAKADDNLVNTLRAHLTSCLPEYMVPTAIVRLDSMPINSNGKLDRKALPAPDNDAFARQVYEEPEGEVETAIAHIWADVLNVDRVSRRDNFFALGGHSLLAVRLMNRVASLGVQLPLSTVFAAPTLLTFAESVSRCTNKDNATYSTIHPIPRDENLPLSFSQQRMWFLAQMDETSEANHISTAVRLGGDLNRDAWQKALNTLFTRHETLRSVFVAIDGQPQVRLLPADSRIPVRWTDLRGSPDVGSQLERMSTKEAKDPFDLERGPLIRILMVQLDNNEHVFMVTQHHIISDGWSLAIFNRELSTLYGAYCNGGSDPLPPLSIQYSDYAAWQKQWLSGDRLVTHTTYWKTALSNAPVLLNLPTDRPRPPQQSFTGDNVPIRLDPDLTRSLKQLCQEHGVTLYMVLLAAWSCVLSRMSGQDDIVIGSPSANRNHHQIESLIGLFINTLALRIDLSGDPTVGQLLERVRQSSLDAQNHQDLPFEQVVDTVQPPRSLRHPPLFQVMFVLQNNEVFEWNVPGLEVVNADGSYDIAKFDLTMELYESGNEITGSLLYSTALFDRVTVERHVGYLCTVLQAMVVNVDRPAMSVDLLSQDERDIVLGEWNKTQQKYPSELCIHQLFEQQVERTPQATALVFSDQSLTYTELNARANRLAHHLIGLGVKPETRVAICVERSIAMIVGILAILKAGGAYVPLDPAFASERLFGILTDASPGIVVADDHGKQALGDDILSSLTVVDPNVTEAGSGSKSVAPGDSSKNHQVPGLTSRSMVYIIYTSGSTGKPKGVMVEHQGLVNLVVTRPEVYGIGASSRMTQFFSIAFDACAFDVFMTLCSGGSLHVLPDNIRMDLPRLWDYLESESIAQTVLTPAVLQHCNNLPRLRKPLTLITTAEATTSTLIKAMYRLIPDGKIVNGYGPTETTVSAMAWECPREFDGDNVPIGRPIPNKTLYLLDEHRHPVPIGAIGELYIGGVGVARGYLNQPELTAKVFLPDPFAGEADARMYKTGDLARYLPDGNLVYHGRNDHQVKIRGFRIELGEIEARLSEHPLVDKAAVTTMGEGSQKMLVAYIVAKPDDNLLNTLRAHLTSCLPEYMVPAAIVRLDSMPINSNGKLDRKALPIPDSDAFARQVYEAPQGDVETAIARIWAEVLNVDRVSRNDNFFALGGHSLLAIQMTERLRRIGLTLSVSALFKTPTLSALGELIQSLNVHHVAEAPKNLITPDTTNITPEMLPLITLSQTDIDYIVNLVPGGVSNIQDIYALSPLQEGILFHHILATEGDIYLLINLMAFKNRNLLDRYLEAIQMVVNRHDILRTAIVHENLSTPAQVVWRQASLSITELMLDPSNGPIPDQLKQRLDPRRHRIDITQAPLLRFTIAQDEDGRWILAEQLHHLIGDHTTLEVSTAETKAFMDGLGHTLPSPQPFRNLVAQAKSSHSQGDHESFFKDMLMDIDTPSLPFGLKDVHGQGDNITTSYQPLPQDLNDRLRKQAKQFGVSIASLCHLAWAQVISRTSGEDRVVFGTVLFGRMNSGQGSDTAMGLFINTLPLRVDLVRTVRESVLQIHERLASLFDHEHASLALAQACSSVPKGTPLFSSMLNYRHSPTSSDTTSIIEGIEYLEYQERTNYPFTLSVEDHGDSLSLTADVMQPFSPIRVCGYMHQALESLSSALEHAPDMMTHELNVIPEDEKELLLRTWNTTLQEYPSELCIHQLFEQQVERTPQATALVFNGQSLTYTELNARANRLAHHLIGLGVKLETRVAICVERSIAMIVGILAILKAGGAYVPLDPAFASERLFGILTDASPGILVADDHGKQALGDDILSSLTVVGPNMTEAGSDSKRQVSQTVAPGDSFKNPQVPGLTSRSLIYIIYTSGSTGKPKGVMVEHQGLLNLTMTRHDHDGYRIRDSSRVLQFFSLAFDACAMGIFMTLCSGASLYLLPDACRYNPRQLWEYIDQNSITHAPLTPAIFQDAEDLPLLGTSLTLIFGGESLPAKLIQMLQPLIPNGRIVNDYGPTEVTVSAIAWTCPPKFDDDIVPIGRPIANKMIYLLDKNQQPVPIGAAGELYIGGVGVARGYLNRPELTAKAFLPDPFAGDKDARMYKTGDLARYLPDGNLEYLGRNDQQVKVRGFRIELGEIEDRLRGHPLVGKAAVITIGEGADKKLVGYVVAKPDNDLLNALRAHLTSCLPEYMVPAAIVRLDCMPINSNGKLDRKALPAPDNDAFARQIYEEPEGEVETAIAHIWAEVLNVDRVSRRDNFFALGGHSLLAVRLMNRVATLGVQLPLSTIFASPTLLSFAVSVSRCTNKESTTYSIIHPIPRDGDLPLSFSQQRMWVLAQMEGVSETYHIPMAVRLRGDLNRDAWQNALNSLFARHEALRSVFVAIDGQPQVRLLPADSGMPICWEDLRGLSDVESQLEQMSANEATNPFDLARGPLIRVLMVQTDTHEHVFMATLHHIVSDGWSSALFIRELSTLYSAYCDGISDPLPPLSIQYSDYAAWQRQWLSGDRLEAHTKYWKTALADAPVLLNLPTDRPRPPQRSYAGESIPFCLDSHLTRALRQLCQEYGVTLYMAILAAWSCVLSRMSGQDDIVIGSPSANRNHHQIESLIGFFINTLALRIDLSGDPTVRQLLQRVQKTSLDAQNHQDLPFEQVVDCVQPPRSLSHSPLFQVMFVLQNNETSEWDLAGLEAVYADSSYEIAKFDLNLGLYESDDEIMGGLAYSTALFDRATMERQIGYLRMMLQAMVKDVNQHIMSVDLLLQAERDLMLGEWNRTQQDYPVDLCIHNLFEHQVERTPQATALAFNGQSMTYTELNERANRLAYHLIGLGVQPESLVAICVERSFAMIVGVLAILKAGGAYVPLDPAYASERLKDILADASPSIVIADATGRMVLGNAVSSMTVLDPNDIQDTDRHSQGNRAENIASSQRICNPCVSGLTSSHLAYIIFTSGSTGKPKGVMIEHQGVVNLIHGRPESFGISTSSRALLFTSLSFDHSVSEIFSALTGGACLHLVQDEIRLDRLRLWDYFERNSISHVSITPTLLQDSKDLPPLTTPLTFVIMGEALPSLLIPQVQKVVPNGKIINEYGPTETTVATTIWKCPRDFHDAIVPIGRPIPNKTMYILDKNQKPVPRGAVGELYIGGIGVARGYLNQPELTAKVFLPDPFSGDEDARMYKTGDQARYLPDGNITSLGRNDHQVKIRGFRVELGEIEARLSDHSLVRSAAVVAMGDGSAKRLVAYVVADHDDQLVHTLRSHLTSCLPEYMVPSAFVRLDELPLSANGKLDRLQLPQPDSNAIARQRYEPPHGTVEIALMTIWMDLLHADKIGRHDNFFMIGGHSLLAMRMVTQIQSLMGFKINLGTLFKAPTIAELVPHLLTAGNNGVDAFDVILPIRPRGSRLPLFCVHHGFGISWSYIGLSKHLHPDQPIYGLQSRGFVGEQTATTLEEMALDYIGQIRQIQPHGPYCLLGYSFGGKVVHTMAAHLERQGERVALLAVMDSGPRMAKSQASIEEPDDETLGDAILQLFVNRVGDTLPDSARPYIERFQKVSWHLSRVSEDHIFPRCNSGLILFRAMVQTDPSQPLVSPEAWRPHVLGEMEVIEIDCAHLDMDQPAPLAEIGGILAQRLDEIHTREAQEH